jgi:RNAse (barnase) inhibitor barstar
VRGQKSHGDARFFDEASASLQFPYYFGENWDAFWECIIDLSWIGKPSFLVVFDRANLLLRDSKRGFSILLRILGQANEYWSRQRGDFGGDMRPVGFHALLACASDALPAVTRCVEATGVPFSLL